MNSAKKRFIAVICFTALTLAGCGMDAETKKDYTNSPAYQVGTEITEPDTVPEPTTASRSSVTAIKTTAKEKKADTTVTTESAAAVKDSSDNQKTYSDNNTSIIQQQDTSNETQNDTPQLAVTTKADTETETTNTETVIHSDSAMYDENDNEIPTSIPNTDHVVIAGDGNVLLNGTLEEQMGRQSVRVSKDEAEKLINMLNQIELEPVDYPDPASIPYGGGFIMDIEGDERCILLGGRYLQIGDKYFYDVNNKSEALSAAIGYIFNS